jgi:hypothetical protein
MIKPESIKVGQIRVQRPKTGQILVPVQPNVKKMY